MRLVYAGIVLLASVFLFALLGDVIVGGESILRYVITLGMAAVALAYSLLQLMRPVPVRVPDRQTPDQNL